MTDEMRADGHKPRTKADLREITSRMDTCFVIMKGDIAELKENVGELIKSVSHLTTAVERMSGNVESILRMQGIQGTMLMEHEERIKKIETRLN